MVNKVLVHACMHCMFVSNAGKWKKLFMIGENSQAEKCGHAAALATALASVYLSD